MKLSTQAWIRFATLDLKAAKKIIDDDSLYNMVLFHCQQTIEKALKGILEEYLLKVEPIHNTHKLYNLLPTEAKAILNININSLLVIDKIYTESRYPSDIGLLPNGDPTKQEAEEILEITNEIFLKVCSFLESIKK